MSKESKSVLYLSLAAPGLGKTESFLNHLEQMIKEGKHVLLALPTIKLSKDIERRCKEKYGNKVSPQVINSEAGCSVTDTLAALLGSKVFKFLVCTHEALHRIDAELLRGWVLVLDEVPSVLSLENCNLSVIERDRLDKYTEEGDFGKLSIKAGKKTDLKQRVENSIARPKESSLSKNEKDIFEALINKIDVYIDEADKKNGKRAYRVINIHNYSTHIEKSDGCHLMCANIAGTLFELFLSFWGIDTRISHLTPEVKQYKNTGRITIFPLLANRSFSKGLALTTENDGYLGVSFPNHQGGQIIDKMLLNTLKTIGNRKRLLFTNKYAKFNWIENPEQWELCGYDSRGINEYKNVCDCILLFVCNPSPLQERSFRNLKAIYGIPEREWKDRYMVTHTYEMAFQNATRSNIRENDSNEKVHLFVPDIRTARYLEKYLPDAKVDHSLEMKVLLRPAEIDNRRIEGNKVEEIAEMTSKGLTQVKIATELGITRQTVSEYQNKSAAG